MAGMICTWSSLVRPTDTRVGHFRAEMVKYLTGEAYNTAREIASWPTPTEGEQAVAFTIEDIEAVLEYIWKPITNRKQYLIRAAIELYLLGYRRSTVLGLRQENISCKMDECGFWELDLYLAKIKGKSNKVCNFLISGNKRLDECICSQWQAFEAYSGTHGIG